jgi:Flp pilus assembly protein TadG
MKSCFRRSGVRSRRGTATVELAVTAPVLFLLVFGVIEFGRALTVQQLLSNAARDGARSAILEGATVEQVEATVTSYLAGSNVPNASVAVTPNPLTSAQGGDPVTVSVSVPFTSVSWLPAPWFLGGATLESTVTMRREVFTSSSEE